MFRRPPDVVIGGEADPYLRRWWVIPRNRVFNVYLHQFLRSDDDRALHDHPWENLSILLRGCYREHLPGGVVRLRKPWRPWAPWRLVVRRAEVAHRIELVDGRPVWTLFLTGPVRRHWGFWCPWGWRHWREFTAGERGETVGRGCD